MFEFLICRVYILQSRTDTLMYEMALVHLRIKPKQTCQHLGAVSYTKLYKALNLFCLFLTHQVHCTSIHALK